MAETTYISLFSGVGCLDLAVRIALPDARCVCYVEGDLGPARILAARIDDGSLDDAPLWADVRSFDGRAWRGLVDGIIGGFPCQDLSVAGKRAGISGERSGLWSEFARTFDPGGYSLRTSQGSLLTSQCGEYSETFPRSGSMRSGSIYERRMSAPRISASACSYWQTPGTDSFRSRGGKRKDEAGLDRQARLWATPQARDWRSGEVSEATRAKNARPLNEQACSRPDLTANTGPASSPTRPGLRPQLNPRFVEWLMGLPLGWTDYAPVAMESWLFRARRHLRSWLGGWE